MKGAYLEQLSRVQAQHSSPAWPPAWGPHGSESQLVLTKTTDPMYLPPTRASRVGGL